MEQSFIQLSRPYLPGNAIKYLQQKNIPDYQLYKQRKTKVFQHLIKIVQILKFPIKDLNTAMIYFQRYYLFNPFNSSLSSSINVALTCLFMACKIEDTFKKLRDIILASNNKYQGNSNNFGSNNITLSTEDERKLEEHRKIILSIEKNLLKAINFDFRTYHIEEILIMICKDLNLSLKLSHLAYVIMIDSLQTEIALRVPPHSIAISCVVLASKFTDEKQIFPLDSKNKYKSDRNLVNESLFEILSFYIDTFNQSYFHSFYPDSLEKFLEIKISLKNEAGLAELPQKVLKNDSYFNLNDANNTTEGYAARYMLGKESDRFYKEVEVNK